MTRMIIEAQLASNKRYTETNAGADFKGQPRSNATHASSTDADARLYCKGDNASRLRFMGHTLSDNRHGFIDKAMVPTANGCAEREAAEVMTHAACEMTSDDTINITLGAEKGFDASEFIEACLAMGVTLHVAQNKSGRRFAVPEKIATSMSYVISQNERNLIEQGFGCAKTVGRVRRVMVRGLKRKDQLFMLTITSYNLTRMPTLWQIRLLTA